MGLVRRDWMWTGTRLTEYRHLYARFACNRNHRLVLCPTGKVSFISPPLTSSLGSSPYHWLGCVLLLLTYHTWGVKIHEGYISSPGPEFQVLAGGRGSVREGRELPGHLPGALLLECSPGVFWTDPRPSGAIWVLTATAKL